jgi:hypothetical protein
MGNDQHHPGTPLHWDKSKSADEMDALIRHALSGEHETVAWRAMANLEREILNGYVPQGFEPKTKDLPEKLSFAKWTTMYGWEDHRLVELGRKEYHVHDLYQEYCANFNADNEQSKKA